MSTSHVSSFISQKMKCFESRESEDSTEENRKQASHGESPRSSMMMSMPPPGVRTDSDGLVLPKKIVNPCLESSDRKNLHRELIFNNKIGKSVLNQKSELQKVLEKKRERRIILEQEAAKNEIGVNGELNRVILERAKKLEEQSKTPNLDSEEHVHPEYLTARARLRNQVQMK